MSGFLLAVRTGFGFLSTIPVGITMEGLDELVKRSYLFVFTGIILGLLIGMFTGIVEYVFPANISAALVIVFIYYLTGLNHLDGLADFGDGCTAHGSLEKKISALKDMSLGIGGVAYCVIGLILLYASISSLQQQIYMTGAISSLPQWTLLPLSLFVSEIGAKQGMLTIAAFGKSIHEGLGSMVIDKTDVGKYLAGLIMGGIVSVLGLGLIGLIGFVAAILGAFGVLNVSNRHFGGVNGDCIGTANEIARLTSLIAITMALFAINTGYGGLSWMLL
jgi:adenosylcobinamide-GDP ribazoletransferase